MSRQIASSTVAALASCLSFGQLGPLAHTAHAAAPTRPYLDVRRDLIAAEAQLREGNVAPRALTRAFDDVHEMRVTGGEEMRAVGMVFLLRGLVAAAEGRAVDAGVDWSAAVAFAPELAQFDLAPYGAAGEALRRAAEDARQVGARAVEAKTLGQAGKGGPRLTRDAHLQPPHYLADCSQARVEIDVWLDETGQVRGFGNPEATCDRGLAVAAISGFRQRRYEPGKDAQGKPIATSLRATVNFRMGLESLMDR